MSRTTPRDLARKLESRPRLPPGTADRFAGYGVLGLPFETRDILAVRRFTVSSVGPAHTSVWHCGPDLRWTVYTDTAPERACARYFATAVDRVRQAEIDLDWTAPHTLAVTVPEHQLDWAVRLEPGRATAPLNLALSVLRLAGPGPETWRGFGRLAGRLLDTAPLELDGRTPDGATFAFRPSRLWLATAAAAVVHGRELGPVALRGPTRTVGGIVVPGRGLFAAGAWAFDTRTPGHTGRAPEPTPPGAGAAR